MGAWAFRGYGGTPEIIPYLVSITSFENFFNLLRTEGEWKRGQMRQSWLRLSLIRLLVMAFSPWLLPELGVLPILPQSCLPGSLPSIPSLSCVNQSNSFHYHLMQLKLPFCHKSSYGILLFSWYILAFWFFNSFFPLISCDVGICLSALL